VRSTLEITNLKLSKAIMAGRHELVAIEDLQQLIRDFYESQDL